MPLALILPGLMLLLLYNCCTSTRRSPWQNANVYRCTCCIPLCQLYDKIGAAIESVLLLLKYRRPDLFNTADKAPDKDQHSVRQNLDQVWPALRRRMRALQLNEGLVACIAEPLEAFLANQCAENISYHLLGYYKTLAAELDYWAAKTVQDPDWELLRLLVAVNFNTTAFCT